MTQVGNSTWCPILTERAAVAVTIVIVLCSAPPAASQQPPVEGIESISSFQLGYSVRHWTIDDGLPSNSIRALGQGPDGYLWIGTNSGVARFNGAEFKNIPLPVPEAAGRVSINSLVAEPGGRLWICAGRGQLFAFDQGRVVEYVEEDGVPKNAGSSLRIVQQSDGEVLLAGMRVETFFLRRFADGEFHPVFEQPSKLPLPARMEGADGGSIWAVSHTGKLIEVADGEVSAPDVGYPPFGFPFFRSDGSLSVMDSRGGLTLRGSEWERSDPFAEGTTVKLNWWDCAEDVEGNIWMGTTTAGIVVRLPDGRVRRLLATREMIPTNSHHVLVDRQGSVWVGSSAGLFQFYRSPFLTLPLGDISQDSRTFAVSEDGEGTVWSVGPRGVEFIEPGMPVQSAPTPLDPGELWTVSGLTGGGAYVGARNDRIWLQQRDGAALLSRGQGAGFQNITQMAASDTGDVWFLSAGGASRVQPPGAPVPAALGIVDSSSRGAILARGPDGLVYVAQQRVGIFRQAGTGWELLQRFEGEGGNLMPVSHMAVAPDGAVWCVFQRRRVARWKDGDWIELGHLPGGFADGGSMAVDGQGGLWLASEYRGVLWVDGRALEVRALGSPELEIPFERFDHGDGLGSLACSGRKGAITCSRDGRVWVATANGLSVIDPARWQELGDRSLDPPVHIEGVSIDGIPEALSGEQSAQISLDASVERFEIEYVSLEFLDPQGVQYYYQLDGFDNDWVAAGDRRTAQYQKLPPGHYSFLVMTKSGRIENSSQARITVSVLPAWWQRRSIRVFGLAVLVGCVWWLYSWRVGEVRRRRAAAEEFSGRLIRSQENERKRIAADLHDGIGQNLLVIKNRLLLAGKELGDQGSPPPEITDIIDVATESIREIRNVSHNLHPFKLERLGLTKAIQSAVRQVNGASEIAVDSDIDPIDGVFPKEREIIVYRIVQECLQNVIKHSNAETASVKIIRGPNAVTVKVADDGIGLSPAAAQPTGRRGEELPVNDSEGLGLKALNERARMLGGRCSWSTPEGGGTEFAFFFPIKQDPE